MWEKAYTWSKEEEVKPEPGHSLNNLCHMATTVRRNALIATHFAATTQLT